MVFCKASGYVRCLYEEQRACFSCSSLCLYCPNHRGSKTEQLLSSQLAFVGVSRNGGVSMQEFFLLALVQELQLLQKLLFFFFWGLDW